MAIGFRLFSPAITNPNLPVKVFLLYLESKI
jgi:hypothetical protein